MTVRALPITLPSGSIRWIEAGPTDKQPEATLLVRCAAEINTPAEKIAVDVSTTDFKPFSEDKLERGLASTIELLEANASLYVGCMGGTGRTGTFLAALVGQHPDMDGEQAIAYVRQIYKPHAVETGAQKAQVVKFSMPKVDTLADRIAEDERMAFGNSFFRKRLVDWFPVLKTYLKVDKRDARS